MQAPEFVDDSAIETSVGSPLVATTWYSALCKPEDVDRTKRRYRIRKDLKTDDQATVEVWMAVRAPVDAGIVFIDENGGGYGVWLKERRSLE